jgi:hypothetical protein
MIRNVQPHDGREERPRAECARAERRDLRGDLGGGLARDGRGGVGGDVGGGERVVRVGVVEAGGEDGVEVGLDGVAEGGYGDL